MHTVVWVGEVELLVAWVDDNVVGGCELTAVVVVDEYCMNVSRDMKGGQQKQTHR